MKINGTNNDDILYGTSGDDNISGRKGWDTLVYDGSVLDFNFTQAKNSWNFSSAAEGSDKLSKIEEVQFADFTLYLDGRNNGPLATSDNITVDEDNSGLHNLISNDWDFEGDTIEFVSLDASALQGSAQIVDASIGIISYDPGSAFQYLAAGETATENFTYEATDGTTTSEGSVIVTITGVNDAPIISAPIIVDTDQNQIGFNIDLLENSSDIDASDILSVQFIDAIGDIGGITLVGSELVVDPSAYRYLPEGTVENITYNYNVTDSNGGVIQTSAEINITGINDVPYHFGHMNWVLAESLAYDFITYGPFFDFGEYDYLDVLSLDNLQLLSGQNYPHWLDEYGELHVDLTTLGDLSYGQDEVLEFSYDIVDLYGGSTLHSHSLIIAGIDETTQNGALLQGDENFDKMVGSVNDDIFISGGGLDIMVGQSGADTFIISNSDDSFSILEDFNRHDYQNYNPDEGDVIDISDLLGDYDAATDDISDFLEAEIVDSYVLTRENEHGDIFSGTLESGGFNDFTMIKVNSDGVGDDFVDVVVIETQGIDLQTLLDTGQLITE